ncbi:MAG: diguanylate cyclase [Burkholderiaceae bacterium]|jgi:diguanylate cyclase (GGDEF)-like protein
MNPSILLVDDDASSIQIISRILAGVGQVRFATTGEVALRLARDSPPDLVVLDAEMPGMSGFQVCEALKADPSLTNVPVIFVTSHNEAAFEVAGFNVGAADFIAKPVNPSLVLARVKSQLRNKKMADELRRIATVDVLTGVANRRQFERFLEVEWRRTRRWEAPLSILMIDVDHFKRYNDRYGHPTGDACLRSVAQALLGASLRPADLVARYGGEEFVILLPHTPRAGAEHVAHGVLEAVESLAIPHEKSGTSRHVTVSIGVSCYDENSRCWVSGSPAARFASASRPSCASIDLVEAADKALYLAKQSGRAQAKFLDISDVRAPHLGRDIFSPSLNSWSVAWA